MKLDSTKHKIYVSRDGRMAVLADPQDSDLQWFVTLLVESRYTWYDDGQELEGDWLPVELPKFPELPPKPPMVLCVSEFDKLPAWRMNISNGTVGQGFMLNSGLFTVIPHPDNDPEAVRLIEEAQKK